MFLRENPTALEEFVLTLCELRVQGADRQITIFSN